MKSICPNINLDSWKSLVKSVGEDNAYRVWITSGFSIPENLDTRNISETIRTLTTQEAKAYVARTLPSTIQLEDMSKLLYTISKDKQAFGAFKDSTIYLAEQAPYGTQFHEAFHAAFRTILTQPQIDQLRTVARDRMSRNGGMAKWIADYQQQGYGLGKTGKELENVVIEEWLADEYSQYVSQANQPKTFLERVWETIRSIANYFSKRHDQIEAIFYNLNSGQLRKYPKAINEFQESGNVAETVFAQIDMGNKPLSQEDTMNIIKNVASTYLKVSRVGVKDVSYKDIQSRLFELMDDRTIEDDAKANEVFNRSYGALYRHYYKEGDFFAGREVLREALRAAYFDGNMASLDSFATDARYHENEGRHNTLEKVLDMFKARYNPMQKGISPELRKKLQDSYHVKVFSKPEIRAQLVPMVRDYLDQISGVLASEDIDELVERDEMGHRNWDQNANETGGFDSASAYVKQYIATTDIKYTDEFGFDKLGTIKGRNGELDIDITRTVNPNKIYYSLLKTLGGSQNTVARLQKLVYFTKGNGNTEAKAFKEKFFKDFGIDEPELMKGNLVMSTSGEDQARFQKIMIAFSLYRKDMYRVLIDPKTGRTTVSHANQNNVGSIQLEKWAERYNEKVQQKTFNRGLAQLKFQTLASLLKQTAEDAAGAQDLLALQSVGILEAAETIGINLSPVFAEYSAAKINSIRATDRLAQLLKIPKRRLREDEALEIETLNEELPVYESIINNYSLEEDQYFSADLAKDLRAIVNRASGSDNPFTITVERTNQEGEAEVIQDKIKFSLAAMAFGNANFDENVIEPTYKNAENKTIYTFQYPTFHLTEIAKLRDPKYVRQILWQGGNPALYGIRDPSIVVGTNKDGTPVYLDSYDANFLRGNILTDSLLAMGDSLKAISLDGIANTSRDATGAKNSSDQNASFRSMSNADFTLGMLNMYAGNKFTYNIDGVKVNASPINLGILEASSTSDYVYLPDITDLYDANKKALSEKSIELIIGEIQREYERIIQVNNQFKLGNVNQVAKYNEKLGDRGFKFSDSIRYYLSQELQQELENSSDPDFATNKKWEAVIGNRRKDIEASIQAKFNKEKADLLAKLVDDGLITKKGKDYKRVLLDKAWFEGSKNERLGRNFDANISQYMMNEFFNGLAMGQILHGDPAMGYKNNGVDRVKRHKGDNAAISSIGFDYPVPDLGIMEGFRHSKVLLIQDFEVQTDKGKINTADGQLYTSISALRKTLHGLGKLTPDISRVLELVDNGIPLNKEQLFTYNDEILGQDYFTNSMKLVYKDAKRYLKMSVAPLTKELTSINIGGVWMARPEMKELHDLRQRMDAEGPHEGRETIDFVGFESASKQVALDILKRDANNQYDYANAKPHLFDNNNFGLQLENPTNKLHITMPTQLIQIIENEQDDDLEVTFPNGETKKMKEVKELYQNSFSSSILNNFRIARADIFKETAMGEEYVALGNFVSRTAKNLASSGADKQLLDLFGVDENGNPRFDLNNNFSRVKYIQSILSHFSKGVLSQKVPGHTAALLSGYGFKLIKKVKLDKDGNVAGWDVIRRDSVEYNNAVRVFSGENQLIEHAPNIGDSLNDNIGSYKNYNGSYYFIDELRHNIPELDENGTRIGYYSEYVLPAHLPKAVETGLLYSATQYAQGVRIPSQDKHSGMNLKLVDYLPTHYGSTGIFAKEIIQLSGADFDIDKEYIITAGVYWDYDKETYVKYGSATTAKGKFDEMVGWYLDNNKEFSALYKIALKELNKDTSDKKQRQANKNKAMSQTLAVFKMPTTAKELQEYTEAGGRELNNGKNHNNMLDAMVQMLQNEYNKEGISDQPATMDALIDVQDKSFDTTKPDHLIVLDAEGNPINGSKINSTVFNTGTFYNTDSLMGKLTAHKNNTTGKRNIGVAVKSNLIGIFVHKHKIQLANDKYKYLIDGVEYGGFDFAEKLDMPGVFTKGQDPIRLFDALSAFISAATDEAKEQQNARYSLTQEKLSIGTTMILQGVHPKTAVMFVNQPILAEYLTLKAGGSTSIKKYSVKKGDGDILAKVLEKYIPKQDHEALSPLYGKYVLDRATLQEVIGPFLKGNPYGNTQLAEALRYGKGDKQLAARENIEEQIANTQLNVFMDYFKVTKISKDLKEIGNLISLIKGLGTELEGVTKITESMDALSVGATPATYEKNIAEENSVIDARAALSSKSETKDQITANNAQMVTGLDKDFQQLFLEHTPLYKEMKLAFNTHLFSTSKDKVIENDLYAFLTLAAYKSYMVKIKNARYDVSWDLINPNKSNSIKQRFDRVKELAKDDPTLAQNSLIKHLLVYNTSKRGWSKTNKRYERIPTDVLQLSFDYISKIDPRNAQDIQEALNELAKYPNPEVVSFAASIFNYVMLKEGMQYRANGISKMLPVEFMQNYTRAISLLHQVTGANTKQRQLSIGYGLYKRGFITEADFNDMNKDKVTLGERKKMLYKSIFGKSSTQLIGDMLDTFASDIKSFTKLKSLEKSKGDKIVLEENLKSRDVRLKDEEGNPIRDENGEIIMITNYEFQGATMGNKSNSLFRSKKVVFTTEEKVQVSRTEFTMPFYFKMDGKVYGMISLAKYNDYGTLLPLQDINIFEYTKVQPKGMRAVYKELRIHGSKELSYAGAAVTSNRYTPKEDELNAIREAEKTELDVEEAEVLEMEMDEVQREKDAILEDPEYDIKQTTEFGPDYSGVEEDLTPIPVPEVQDPMMDAIKEDQLQSDELAKRTIIEDFTDDIRIKGELGDDRKCNPNK